VSYTVTPNYAYPNGSAPTLTGYTVTNVVEVTLTDLGSVGKVIDTAIGAGANNVQRLTFGLKDDSSVRQQALRLATQQATSDANAIASGLNVHTGGVLSAAEETTSTPTPVYAVLSAAAPSTPVQPSNLVIEATVTIEVQISQ
ncbi:MAG: SIMPL domain-containing protein, partial [Bryobacteraceae bacterium]